VHSKDEMDDKRNDKMRDGRLLVIPTQTVGILCRKNANLMALMMMT
jgi:hypothetical protein